MPHDPLWVHGHSHEPNLQTPAGDSSFVVITPRSRRRFTPADLATLPLTWISNCYIVSTGHGISGPFTFGGVRLSDLIAYVFAAEEAEEPGANQPLATGTERGEERDPYRAQGRSEGREPAAPWQHIDLVSADGFGTRLAPEDMDAGERPPLLAYWVEGQPMTRAQGLVRLIVPSETDDALRQVKWLAAVTIV
jgi:hypothetical protein